MNSLRKLLFLIAFFGISGLWQCSSTESAREVAEQGAQYVYQPGFPEFRATAIGSFSAEGVPGIEIFADVVYASLVFNQVNKKYRAEFLLSIQVIETSREPNKSGGTSFTYVIENPSRSVTMSQETYKIAERLIAPPGEYRVIINIQDQSSKKSLTYEEQTTIPDPTSEKMHLTSVLMMAKSADQDAYDVTTTYDVRGKVDSLKFTYQLNKQAGSRIRLVSQLYKFPSDSSAARYLTAQNIQSGLTWLGINYDNAKVLNSTSRSFSQDDANVTFEFPYAMLDRGNYRFEVIIYEDDKEVERQARDFGIKNPYYPTLRTVRELAEPLVYLMSEKEYEEMMSYSSPDSMKRAMDSFWLKNIRNPNLAKNVVQLYYSRVEEANKRFSCYKEGWKTDMGMIFILFGPPWYVQREFQSMLWQYGFNTNNASLSFNFELIRPTGKKHPFDVYQLIRRNYYGQVYNNKVGDWLDGSILSRDI